MDTDSAWTPDEALELNAALYLLEASLVPDDPRRALLRSARFLPFDRMPAIEGPRPEATEALFSVRTGSIYVNRPSNATFSALASALAHELHHMERDHTDSVNRMQECDRERLAHAREADDTGRMLALLRERWPKATSCFPALELSQARAGALAAMYTTKFELFRLVQALDRVPGLRDMPTLFQAYERCIAVAQSKLSTDHGEELLLLGALSAAAKGTDAEPVVAEPLKRARSAVLACAPLEAVVTALRQGEDSRSDVDGAAPVAEAGDTGRLR